MHEWNVLVTSLMGHSRDLKKVLKEFGDFKATGFRGVLLGRVDSVEGFLERLKDLAAERPEIERILGRVIPFDKVLHFAVPEELAEKLYEAVSDYIPQLTGKKFHVRIERRGFKGKISSPEVERAIDQFVLKRVDETGGETKVDFEDPDLTIVIETVSNLVGIRLLTRGEREKYPFVRVE